MLRPTRAAANGIWTMDEVSENIIDTTWPTAVDANFASVTVLIHGDDAEGYSSGGVLANQHWRNCATPSTHSKVFTIQGGSAVELSNAITPKFGANCIKVNNTGLGLTSNVNDFAFGTGDFTIEGWFYFTTLAGSNIMDCRPTSATNGNYPLFYCLSNLGSLRYNVNSLDKITGANGTLVANTWTHIAVSRVSGSTRMYASGAQAGATFVDATNYIATAQYWGSSNAAGPIVGYMQELRTTVGVGRYTGATLTVPTTKFADTA